MRVRKVVKKPIRVSRPGLNIAGDINASIAANVGERGTTNRVSTTSHTRSIQGPGRHAGGTDTSIGGTALSEEVKAQDQQGVELSSEELEQQQAEELPDREAMSLINANIAAPVNAAVALNALSDNSTAIADATQTDHIQQTN